MKKTIIALLVVLLGTALLAGCVGANETGTETNGNGTTAMETKDILYAEIEMENGGVIKLALYRDVAPITVDNFVKLASEGFYDGLTFHRVIKGFMIQGGDPDGDGTGGSGTEIKGEFAANGVNNTLSHKRGVISMARARAFDSASSQFFICHADAPHLDGQYAAFGEVIEGMDVVDEIANVKCNYSMADRAYSIPAERVVIKTVRVVEK